MPYDLKIPTALKNDGWKVKIFEKEIAEPPHVSIIKKMDHWRIDLRTGAFMDREPPKRKVDRALVIFILRHKAELVNAWNKKYPHNPV